LKKVKFDGPRPERMLLSIVNTTSVDPQKSIEDRGVDGGYLYNFLLGVQTMRYATLKSWDDDMRASEMRVDIPEPPGPRPREYALELNARSFVESHVLPWTAQYKTSLFERVPEEHRGPPASFLSYTWGSDFFHDGYGVIDAASDLLNDGECVWMDVFCHNQHDVGSVAEQMETVISRVDRLLLPMSEPPWYQRAWCLWEVLCAIKHKKETHFLEYEKKHRDFRRSRWYYLSGFQGIEESGATFTEDKELIISLARRMFGSTAGADLQIRQMMEEKIGDNSPPGAPLL
jgi:hypothetical protein